MNKILTADAPSPQHGDERRREIMQRRLKIGVLYSRVRVEEKWIFAAMEKRGIDYDRLDDRAISFDLENPEPWQQYDAVLERSISYTSGLYALRLLNAFGVPTVNTAAVAEDLRRQVDHVRDAGEGGRAAAAQCGGVHARSRVGSDRSIWLPGCVEACRRFVGTAAGEDQ